MIPMRLIQKVSFALPKTYIDAPDDAGVMYIYDQNANEIAHIHVREGFFTIYDDYEYCEQVIDALESQGETVRDMIKIREQRKKEWLDQNPDKAKLEKEMSEADLFYGD